MTLTGACPICGTPRPANRASCDPWYCSVACFKSGNGIDQPEPPSCHDAVTMTCPVCQGSFTASGRRRFCSDACKATAYRRRRDASHGLLTVPKAQPRRPITVYECDSCGDRALAEQHCPTCNTWMRRVGLGGSCPECDQPVTVNELLGQEVTP